MARSTPRSLADDLRARSDEQLAALLRLRPDLVHPVPADLAALAQRAGSPPSVASALRGLDELSLHVLLAAALGPDPTTPAAVLRALSPHQAREVIARLRAAGLLWGTDRTLRVVGAARDLLVPPDRGPRIAAFDAVVAGYAREPGSLRALLDTAPQGASAALDRLLAGPLIGTVMNARREPAPERSPVDWLLAHHLIVPLGADRAVVPAEVATILRGASSGRDAEPIPVAALTPPLPTAHVTDPERVDASAVGAVLDLLHAVAELGALWTDAPPARVRTGGISQRDLTRTARAVGQSEPVTALTIEVAAAAGLLGPDSGEQLSVLPTLAFDRWLGQDPAARYADLLIAWLDLPRAIAGPGERPMDAALAAPALPSLRREVLAALASAAGSWTAGELSEAVRWHAPRRADPARIDQVRVLQSELVTLGIAVGGALTRAGRALLADDRSALEAAMGAVLPPQVDTLILQADLTAIVPGLPTPELAALMRLAAQVESTGAASVYRFTPDSIRTALDSGRSAGDLLADLARRGTVPQPLAYLIEDVGRRHASLRIGAAATFLRCDDPVLLATILADPAAAALGLFPLSETVLASDQPPEHVLDRLRQLGHSPQPEPGAGLQAPATRRARSRPRAEAAESSSGAVTPALAAAAVRAMRASDRPEAARRAEGAAHPVPPGAPAEIVAILRAAIDKDEAVWIGYADPSGVTGDRRVEPLRVAGGYLTALDLRTEAIQSFALARITGVEPA